MGTNYYAYEDACPHCGRSDERLHIGKASAGWVFTWHGDKDEHLISCDQWFERLAIPTTKIRDEYGKEVSLADFRSLVDSKRKAPHHHAREYPASDQWTDVDGCSFSGGEFS